MAEQKTTVELVTKPLEGGIIDPIRETNAKIQEMVNVFGQLYLRKKELNEELNALETNLEKAEEDFKNLNSELKGLLSTLDKDYPRGQIDLREGTITYRPDFVQEIGEGVEVEELTPKQ